MSESKQVNRRKAFAVAGAAGLGVLVARPSAALASKYKRLDTALAEMKGAVDFLKDAPAKFGGHKKKAIEALNTAIAEINAAIDFADKN